ncbi:MAG: hypothetical protein ACTSR3_01235 [Candidatus Helarchaeota archaeon]
MNENEVNEIKQAINNAHDHLDSINIELHEALAVVYRNKKEVLNQKNILTLITEALTRAGILEKNGNQIKINKDLLEEKNNDNN